MTEPWIAFPPEVHSAMLNYGAGVGPMLISATQNGELSAQYAEAASEVEELLGVVASEGWQGQAAEAFVAAYMPFLAWLIQASADCVEMAAQQHVVIEAYTAAVELMPTQVELAANQIKLAVLVATNFFGINTIPIAINEAEYVEMWVRAATTMATYSTVSRSALSAMPHTSPPPLILKSDELLPDTGEDSDEDGHNHGGHSHGGHARMIDNFFAEILRGVSAGRIVWDPVNGTLNGLDYDDYVYPGHAIWWLVSAGRIVWDPVNGTLNGLDYDDYVYPGHAIWWLARAQLKLLGGRSPGRDSGGRRVTPPAAFERVAPECPDWLPPGAKDMWGRVVPELAALNLLKESDLGVLTSFCVAWDQLMQAVTAYREQGFIATNARSRRVTVHACRGRGPGATRDVLVLARELGCTPSAEANLAAVLAAAGTDDDEFNPFAPDR